MIVNEEAAFVAATRGVEMKQLDVLATVLVVVGALNWGLVGVARFDLVAALFGMRFGETSALTSIVYALVGLAGMYQALAFKGMSRRWLAAPATR
jgi:uncharacterized membrane protein YuzA (DUF378 family)